MAVDFVLIIFIVGYMLIALLVDLKILFYFEHVDDTTFGSQLFAKLVILIGLQLLWLIIILLPIDAYNQNPPFLEKTERNKNTAGLDMELFWFTTWWFTAIYLVIPLPFALFYYESDDDLRITQKAPWKQALCYTLFSVVITTLIIGIIYIFVNSAILFIDIDICRFVNKSTVDKELLRICNMVNSNNQIFVWNKTISFSVYLITIMSFVGWFVFVLFVGIGLTALPLDIIINFIDRPKPINLLEYSEKKKFLGDKAAALKLVGESIKRQQAQMHNLSTWIGRKQNVFIKNDLNKYKQAVHLLEKEYNNLNISILQKGENLFFSYVKLICGFLSVILSVLWVFHICIYMIIPKIVYINPSTYIWLGFLDAFLAVLVENDMGILSLVIYCVLIVYLLLCVMKGCFKFGMRIFCCISIYPIKKNETHLNSLLFNIAMLLISSSAIVQFAQTAFRNFCKMTVAVWIFEVQVQFIQFFGLFFRYNIFLYMLVGWFLITLLYLSFRSRDKIPYNVNLKPLSPNLQSIAIIEMERNKIEKNACSTYKWDEESFLKEDENETFKDVSEQKNKTLEFKGKTKGAKKAISISHNNTNNNEQDLLENMIGFYEKNTPDEDQHSEDDCTKNIFKDQANQKAHLNLKDDKKNEDNLFFYAKTKQWGKRGKVSPQE